MEVKVIKKRQKNLYLRVKGNQVVCTAPLRCSDDYINGFINSKRDWINARLSEIEKRVSLSRVFYEEDYARAAQIFLGILNEYLLFYNEEPVKLLIKELKSKWGSCNKRRRVINLNIKLLDLDEQIIRYVIAHEVAHLRYADHSRNFYSHLALAFPTYKSASRLLRLYTIK